MCDPDSAKQAQLARSVFEQEYEELRHNRPEDAASAYHLPVELLSSIHDALIAREKADAATLRYRKVVIAGGSKHYSSKSLSELTFARLENLKLGCANRGKAVLLKICSDTCRTASLQFLAEDQSGWRMPVSLYHASSTLAGLCRKGLIFALCEPWLKESRDGYLIRVDSPSDMIFWPEIAWQTLSGDQQTSIRRARGEGSRLFSQNDLIGAVHAYEEGLYASGAYWRPSSTIDQTIVHLNAAAAYLRLSMPSPALRHLELCNPQHLEPKQKAKHAFRKGSALYMLRRYQKCLSYLSRVDTSNIGTEETSHLQKTAEQRLQEEEFGTYSWRSLFKRLQEGEMPEMADYTGPVRVAAMGSKGIGLVVTREVKAGELLLVCNPLAASGVYSKPNASVVGLNLASESLDPPSVLQVAAGLYDKVRDQPKICAELHRMYAGPTFVRSEASTATDLERMNTSIDAGRIEGILAYNSFRPRSVVPYTVDEQPSSESDNLISPTALYYLPSMINHSCMANSSFVFYGDVLVLRAAQRIESIAEVTISYCDPTASVEQRKLHLSRYGFECDCILCKEDAEIDVPSLEDARYRLEVLSDGIPSPSAVLHLIEDLKALYGKQRTAPVHDLYRCHRLLSTSYFQSGNNAKLAISSEIAALEALGARIDLEGFSYERRSVADKSPMVRGPSICIQDAINSCLKLSHECSSLKDKRQAKKWLSEAVRLHDLEFGPDTFALRMTPFLKAQSWDDVVAQLEVT